MEKLDDTHIENFTVYLAKALIAKKGFKPGTLPEASDLYKYCDAVLTRANGMTVDIIGIVDREANPARSLSPTKEVLDAIGMACRNYSGKIGFRKLPVTIHIVEMSGTPFSEEMLKRLKLLKSQSPFSKVLISSWALDAVNHKLWTNATLGGRLGMRSFLEELMTGPPLTNEDLEMQAPPAMAEHRPLLLTYGLLTAIVGAFLCEYFFRVEPASGLFDPSIRTLIALGALDRNLVSEGEWWRIFSAPFLHGGLLHIVFNGIALYLAGAVLENVVGRAWFAAIFAVSGVCGSVFSLTLNEASLISVGASGAIMGLFAAAFAVGYRYPKSSLMRSYLHSGSLRVLIPSMIPLAGGLTGEKIDIAAHFGGAVGGVVLGASLACCWAREKELPPYRWLALIIAAAGLCGVLYGASRIAKGYEQYNLASYLMPQDKIPAKDAGDEDNSAALVASYPRDPRSHMYRALSLYRSGDTAGAEREWKAGLAENKILHLFFKPELEQFMRGELALTLKENGKGIEAKETARPICALNNQIREALTKEQLCP